MISPGVITFHFYFFHSHFFIDNDDVIAPSLFRGGTSRVVPCICSLSTDDLLLIASISALSIAFKTVGKKPLLAFSARSIRNNTAWTVSGLGMHIGVLSKKKKKLSKKSLRDFLMV